jgi:drug/metabolite transporter (DMT)-like permease
MTVLALLAAVAAMLANTAASLLESAGTHRATSDRPVWRQPRYLIGLACDGAGWLLSVVALRVLPVFAVQSVLAGTVAATPVAAAGGDPRRLSVRQRTAVAGVVLGLALVAASALPGRAPRLPAATTPVLLVAAAVLLAALLPVRRSGRPLLTTVVAGLAFGGVSLAVRAVHVRSSLWTSLLDLLTEPLAWAVVVFGVIGTVLLAAALRRGVVGTVVAVLAVTEVIAPGLVGLVLLGDRVRPGWIAVLVAGWLLTVAGVVLLARSPAVSGAGSRQ